MRALFLDTETTGMPDFGAPSESPQQPHIVQLAAALVDVDMRRTIASVDLVVKPEGWEIPAEVTAIHGITTEHAADVGVPETLAIEALLALWRSAQVRIGHNESFDARIVRIGLKRFQDDVIADAWKAFPAECTMRQARPICALPKSKAPTLAEAHAILCGSPLHGAHSALGDMLGCMAVYWALRDREAMAVA